MKVNIPLLDIIKQVPAYAKFLKDLCTIKKGLGIEKKAFLTEHVSAIIQSKYPVKYKDPGSPTISVTIGGNCIDKSLLDLGASVNLMPYSVYKQFGLGELKPTNITLSLVDRSVKIPKGIVEDVLVKIDKFYYPVDFVVLDTEPIAIEPNHVPIILGRPFLATANVIINCRNGIMQLTFGNMTCVSPSQRSPASPSLCRRRLSLSTATAAVRRDQSQPCRSLVILCPCPCISAQSPCTSV